MLRVVAVFMDFWGAANTNLFSFLFTHSKLYVPVRSRNVTESMLGQVAENPP